jgi:hypothetical protein
VQTLSQTRGPHLSIIQSSNSVQSYGSGVTAMYHYLLILIAVLAVVSEPMLENLTSTGFATDYMVAFAVALLLKPWLETHLE